ncbi:monovalent cation/H+ antiporter complex subunit F [Roseiflexus castenholzii]|jgi:multicomponent Na+:H+ antiporter subunit F|uniref:Multiple resistance and pH regulation protein F n=1 Tax=Roseiflexus castenholzii (strain DSM 13941 / HLO8) TaxID=383372 RepID=A7NK45_ROSCS|nr:monovalent cation/H+ antiporter complex subunit F [Roseiflexus castenholzii]ABU57865.1 multiple resistance and pH regulation protein F [Roseiflexus castenholzii DSM 13941]
MVQIIALWVVLPLLSIAVALPVIRLVRGPSLPDRVVALDVMGTIAIAIFAAYALTNSKPAFLDAALVVGLIGFIGTIAFAYYTERRI